MLGDLAHVDTWIFDLDNTLYPAKADLFALIDSMGMVKLPDLLTRLQQERGLTYLFIGHDLAVIERMSHDVLVLRGGESVEYRSAAELFAHPEHEYTRALLAAVPPARPGRATMT